MGVQLFEVLFRQILHELAGELEVALFGADDAHRVFIGDLAARLAGGDMYGEGHLQASGKGGVVFIEGQNLFSEFVGNASGG